MYKAFISYSHSADSKLALVLQKALQGFAKPWYRLRNFNIFRDEDTLLSTQDLEGNISAALKEAEFLIFLASPASARSKWVQKEIAYWLENKPIDKLIIVLTDGEIRWDNYKTFSDSPVNALPALLRNKIASEPFYVDLREIKTSQDLSLHNPIFKKEILKLAAPLHNKLPKDLAGDEVTAHRKMIQVRNGAIAALTLLLMSALIAGIIANQNKKQAINNMNLALKNESEANQQRKIAIIQKDSANLARAYAVAQEHVARLAKDTAIIERDNAVKQREIAIEQKKRAMANFLTSEARKISDEDPTLALRLLEQAIRYNDNNFIRQAALNIYLNNNFYKCADEAEISKLWSGKRLNNNQSDAPILSPNDDSVFKAVFPSLYKINYSADSLYIIAFSKEGQFKIKELSKQKTAKLKTDSVITFSINTNTAITNAQLLADKRLVLVTEDYSTIVKIYNFKGEHIQDLVGHEHPVLNIFFDKENTIYTSSMGYYRTEKCAIRKWSVKNTVLDDSENQNSIINQAAKHDMKTDGKTFSPDGMTYLQNKWNDFDYTMRVYLYNIHGQLLTDFFVPTELITAAAYSPDGKYIFLGLADGTVKLYNHQGFLLKTLNIGNQKKITGISFTSDNKKAIFSSANDICKTWRLPPALDVFLKSGIAEPLSASQKKLYGIE